MLVIIASILCKEVKKQVAAKKLPFVKYQHPVIYVKGEIFYSMKIRHGLILSFLSIFLLFACKKADLTTNDTDGNANGQKPDFAYGVNAATMLDLINDVRSKGCTCGTTEMPAVEALSWNDLLGKAAYGHSSDMNANNYFSHTGLDGSSPGDRITAQGYKWTAYGENIASGQTTEQIVMDSWLHSEGHCKNIMSKSFKEIGVGRSGNFWTQAFGSK